MDLQKELTHQIASCLLDASNLRSKGESQNALEKSREASRLENQLRRLHQENGNAECLKGDLSFSVCFNLAIQESAAGNTAEAMNILNKMIILPNERQYSGRFRCNLGNIYFKTGQYSSAIKMFKMAKDALPPTSSFDRACITRNIGNIFLQTGKFTDAVGQYEQLPRGCFDHCTALNLVICYFILKDQEKLKTSFTRMITIPMVSDPDDSEGLLTLDKILTAPADSTGAGDPLTALVSQRLRVAARAILQAAELVACQIGLDWICEALTGQGLNYLASEVELMKATHLLRTRQFEAAAGALRQFERREKSQQARAAVNLTFLKFCESDFQAAESFADVALAADPAAASALVNKGNCRATADDLVQARRLYSEACDSNPACLEALYNLGLVCKRLGDTLAAISAFEKLRALCSQGERTALDLDVLWQLADLHLATGDPGKAKELLLILASGPRQTDAGVLAKLAEIFNQEGDELQAYHFYAESLKFWPKNLQVLGWLGVYYVRHELFELAIPLFLRGAELQPEDKKWLMLVASCYRRSGSNQNALAVYEQVAERYPDDVECLRYLVTLAREISSPKLELYAGRLARAERLLTGELGDLEIPTAPARPIESRKPTAAPDPKDERWSELPDIGI